MRVHRKFFEVLLYIKDLGFFFGRSRPHQKKKKTIAFGFLISRFESWGKAENFIRETFGSSLGVCDSLGHKFTCVSPVCIGCAPIRDLFDLSLVQVKLNRY